MNDLFDIAVVGAGAAGLAAAVKAERAGARVAVIEARDRIGGRIFTHRDPLCAIPIELGAEFAHGKSPHLWRQLDRSGLRAARVGGDHTCLAEGSYIECDDVVEQLSTVLDHARLQEDRPVSEVLAGTNLTSTARNRVVSYIEGFNAATASRASTVALQQQQKAERDIEGDSSFRVLDGYESVPLSLYRELAAPDRTVRLSTIVRAVEWRPGDVELRIESALGGDLATVRAGKIILTVPIAVLRAGALEFRPEPPGLADALSRMETGQALRITLRFRRRFWEDRNELKGVGFVHAYGQPFPTWWTQNPSEAPFLTAWAGGPEAERLLDAGQPLETAIATCAAVLQTNPDIVREELCASYFHDWRADRFSLGAYTWVAAGALPAVEKLTRPIDNTIFIAGEATDTEGHWGTVHGAIASGERAAGPAVRGDLTRV
jgi:monoamine oxidase